MVNIHKYFNIIENLTKNVTSEKNDLTSRLEIIKKCIKREEFCEKANSQLLNYSNDNEQNDLSWEYASYLFNILLSISKTVDLNSDNKDDLISIHQQELFISALIEASKFGICPNLLSEIQKHQLFKQDFNSGKINVQKLNICLSFLEDIFKINFVVAGSKIDEVKLQSMAAIFSVISNENAGEDFEFYSKFLTFFWDHFCKVNYFRNLLILESISNLPLITQKQLHQDLLMKLQTNIGFKVLLQSIVPSTNSETPDWKCFEIVANIVSHSGHRDKFYENLLKQIFEFMETASGIEEQYRYIPGGVLSLRKLYTLKNVLKDKIRNWIDQHFQKLYNPTDIISGIIIMENTEFINNLKLWSFLFCGSSQQSMPSEILIEYLPLLIQLFNEIPETYKQANMLKSLIIQCLANRTKNELKMILKHLILEEFDAQFKTLHQRIYFVLNEKSNSINIQIGNPEVNDCRNDIFIGLTKILKNSNNNILIYNCFISVLHVFDEKNFEVDNFSNSSECLLQNEDELKSFIEKKFKPKYAVIAFLTDLIEFSPLHSQFKEYPSEILDYLHSSLNKHLKNKELLPMEEKLSITLAIFHELVANASDLEMFQKFVPILEKFSILDMPIAVKHQIQSILSLLKGNNQGTVPKRNIFEKSDYEIARRFIEEKQPYLRVYGISLMTKLIDKKDEETISNRHAVLAIGLLALKDEDSYTFLNCVKLFVTLINTIEVEVLNTLADEYLCENNCVDYRLKIGEAMLKVTEDLGPLSYKYKGILFNCFLNGCRNPLDEFRLSSISNLATVCKLLTFQVHNFFQELLYLIETILQTDKYLPARRAIAHVLTQLLTGMENLLDFEEYLLPVYRILKNIATNDEDNVLRIHANNGLKILNEKCIKLLTAEQQLQKEIQIFGINDKPKNEKSGFILELN